MANFVLNAVAREEAVQGKGSSRRLRLQNKVPAIIYGGAAEPVAVTLELRELVKVLENNAFFEEVVEINIDGKVESVKIQALQRHPSKNTPMHADFKRA
ncbi:50S ribosomal protein L25 [Acinetobacter bereziniae]|jgi:large subunit ribosomal protein L25|uniref:Large ribosomal subunit protein bL25 n=3 Tax=Acinetobacter bereziniae TaxID=106648 RepID=A0A3R9ZCW3_ACIBZ|nr:MULTISPECIES: 50S ribosomal protein L25 [Acinetobacter]MEC8124351.1 50S ribosomal protein L25 [Pseudomonadota bacterium]ATZ62766.1 50S ribosomal protein L25 [Acinetobacter bereziniae]ENV23502.1 50S ribosomal protein L25 [Acinetobacter bereziniae NIPH 3]ENV97173.1 50S ribosomal protein L25 [Acinetobacter bereziniae LMG 1003 = CIP 70.12]MBJ8423195.1 50S ribosomal protein L25 [Acinetobacter bereziniae]